MLRQFSPLCMAPTECQAVEKLLNYFLGSIEALGEELNTGVTNDCQPAADNSIPRHPSSVSAEYLCLGKGFLAVLFVSLQLLDVDGVVAAVQLQEANKQGVGSLQLLQGPLILRQLVGIPSRPLSLEGVL